MAPLIANTRGILRQVSQCIDIINTILQILKLYSHYQHGRGCGGVFSNGTAMPEYLVM